MKKNLFFSLFILCFLLSSCELLELLLDDSGYSGGNYKYKETLVDVPILGNDDESTEPDSQVDYEITSDSKKTVYLVKLNNSDDIINKNHTGYVKSIKYRNAAENPVCNTDNFIRKLNEELTVIPMQQAQRSAVSDYIVENYSSKTYTKGQTETFWSYVNIKNKDTSYEEYVPGQVNATCKYAGEYCYVFADDSDSRKSSKGINLSSNDYVALGQKFDECYELETGILGNPLYKKYHSYYFVPCNQKVIILVSDLFGDAQPKQDGGTVGYFYNGDLYTENYINQIYGNKYHTNKCEMFYIDSLFFTSRKDTVYSTLIHEFNHMINYVVKTINDLTENPEATSFNSCDVWYTEMLAMVTEDLFQKKLGIDDEHSPKGRLPLFNMYYNYGYRLWIAFS